MMSTSTFLVREDGDEVAISQQVDEKLESVADKTKQMLIGRHQTFVIRDEHGNEIEPHLLSQLVDDKFSREEQQDDDAAPPSCNLGTTLGHPAATLDKKEMLIGRHSTFVARDADDEDLSQQVDHKFSRQDNDEEEIENQSEGLAGRKKMLIGRHHTFLVRDEDGVETEITKDVYDTFTTEQEVWGGWGGGG